MQAAAVTAFGLVSGCKVFDKPTGLFQQVKKLPSLSAPPDAMRFDVVFVERPVGDALMGPKLWQSVDELGAHEKGKSEILRRNGLRAGVVGSTPPAALQTLLGLKSDFAYEPTAERSKHLTGQQITLRSEGETEIQVSPVVPEGTVEISDSRQMIARSYNQCCGMFRVVAHRLQDGWARMEFIPVIRHGAESLHHVAGSEGWQFANGQKSESFYSQKFEVTLSVGEMAVISADDIAANSLGQLFFIGKSHLPSTNGATEDKGDVHRMLVIRLSDMPLNDNPYESRAKTTVSVD